MNKFIYISYLLLILVVSQINCAKNKAFGYILFKNIIVLNTISTYAINAESIFTEDLKSKNNINASNNINAKNLIAEKTITAKSIFTKNITGNLDGNISGKASLNVLKSGDIMTGPLTVPTVNGNLVGNVTGNLEGNVTGNVIGNLIGSVTGNVYGELTGDVTGNLIGTATGNLFGNVTGNVTGDLIGTATGNFYGDLTGNVNGSVTGDLIGTATGNFYGDLTGNLNGTVIGDLTGNVTGNVNGAASLNFLIAGDTFTGPITLSDCYHYNAIYLENSYYVTPEDDYIHLSNNYNYIDMTAAAQTIRLDLISQSSRGRIIVFVNKSDSNKYITVLNGSLYPSTMTIYAERGASIICADDINKIWLLLTQAQ